MDELHEVDERDDEAVTVWPLVLVAFVAGVIVGAAVVLAVVLA